MLAANYAELVYPLGKVEHTWDLSNDGPCHTGSDTGADKMRVFRKSLPARGAHTIILTLHDMRQTH